MNFLVEQLNYVCKQIRQTHFEPVTFKQLIHTTRKELKKNNFEVTLKTKKDKNLDVNRFYIHAFYDAEDDKDNEIPIEIIIYYNFDLVNYFSKPQITEFLIEIFDAILHEYKHRSQSSKRNYKTYFQNHADYKGYLQDPDEMDAYAFSIAIDFLRYWPKYKAQRYMSRITVMSKMRHNLHYISPTLQMYIHIFGFCKITKGLSKKIYKHLQTLDKDSIFV
ncbi:MAG: hypothetical protein RLZZ196_1194 [Bacteroidota bacterium]|jgi:hypothetical protein